jgi:hypothetical protein
MTDKRKAALAEYRRLVDKYRFERVRALVKAARYGEAAGYMAEASTLLADMMWEG